MKKVLSALVFPGFLIGMIAVASIASAAEGVFHMKFDEVDFYCLQDKNGEMDNAIFGNDATIANLVPGGKSPSSFNVFVVKKGKTTVLIDTGAGGQILDRLATIGIKPESMTAVFLTHTHGDHIGGLLNQDNSAVFPNASLWLSEKESQFWNESNKTLADKCRTAYGELKTIVADEKTPLLLPELTAFDLAGHTPGHTGFMVVAGDTKIVIVGDLLHSAAIQFARPDINARFDRDPQAAVTMRKKWMQRAAEEKLLFTGSYLPFPGIGHVEVDGKADGGAFRFVPLTTTQGARQMKHFHDFTVKDINGNDFPLSQLKGKKVLVVNVASKCGLTPQYKELQELYTKYGNGNFTIIAFPANNFGQQEPGTNSEIKEFCTKNYGVTFPVMAKISVTGDDMHPLYHWLTEKNLNGKQDVKMEWNFQKFLIDENGNWVDFVPPREKPNCEKIIQWIE